MEHSSNLVLGGSRGGSGGAGCRGALLRLLEKPNLIGGGTDKRNASHLAVKIRFPRLVYLNICCFEA